MEKRILILGGTGLLGRPVARRLQTDGFRVRLLARDVSKACGLFGQTVEVVQGDVSDRDVLDKSLAGCSGVHISVAGPFDQLSAENVATLAPLHGLERITYISGSTVAEKHGWFPVVRQKLLAEKAVRECGVPYTIFCPTWPFESLPSFVRNGRASVIGSQPIPVHPFAGNDLGRMVSTAFQLESAANRRLYVHGPEAMPLKQAVERYCQAVHPQIRAVSTKPAWLVRWRGRLTGDSSLVFTADLMTYLGRAGELGDPTEANELLGAPATTLDEWLQQIF